MLLTTFGMNARAALCRVLEHGREALTDADTQRLRIANSWVDSCEILFSRRADIEHIVGMHD